MPLPLRCSVCGREAPAGSEVCPRDGSPLLKFPPVSELGGQKVFECRYVLKERIGAGGMGVVYRGIEPQIGKQVAVKVLKLELADDARLMERLLLEARSVNAIRHRGIIDIIGLGQLPDRRHYLVMEYLVGMPLDAFLRQNPVVPLATALPILDEILAALGAAHGAGVVHRDLKPSNVFLVEQADGSRFVKLLDFGIAKITPPYQEAPPTTGGNIIGTPEYMAPEQVRYEFIGPRTDLYAFGVLAFQMFTGRLPFRADNPWKVMVSHTQDAPPLPSTLAPGIPPQLDSLILKLLAKEPNQRPASADAVRQVLQELREEPRSAEAITLRGPPPQEVLVSLQAPAAPQEPLAKPDATPSLPSEPPEKQKPPTTAQPADVETQEQSGLPQPALAQARNTLPQFQLAHVKEQEAPATAQPVDVETQAQPSLPQPALAEVRETSPQLQLAPVEKQEPPTTSQPATVETQEQSGLPQPALAEAREMSPRFQPAPIEEREPLATVQLAAAEVRKLSVLPQPAPVEAKKASPQFQLPPLKEREPAARPLMAEKRRRFASPLAVLLGGTSVAVLLGGTSFLFGVAVPTPREPQAPTHFVDGGTSHPARPTFPPSPSPPDKCEEAKKWDILVLDEGALKHATETFKHCGELHPKCAEAKSWNTKGLDESALKNARGVFERCSGLHPKDSIICERLRHIYYKLDLAEALHAQAQKCDALSSTQGT